MRLTGTTHSSYALSIALLQMLQVEMCGNSTREFDMFV